MFSIHCALEDLAKLETGGYYADCALAKKAPQVINFNYDEGDVGDDDDVVVAAKIRLCSCCIKGAACQWRYLPHRQNLFTFVRIVFYCFPNIRRRLPLTLQDFGP